MWIKRVLELAMQTTHDFARCVWPPPFFCQTDSVLARDYAAPRQHLRKKIVERLFHFVAHDRVTIISIRHDVHMNVAVAGVTETGDGKSVFFLKRSCEFD